MKKKLLFKKNNPRNNKWTKNLWKKPQKLKWNKNLKNHQKKLKKLFHQKKIELN
jgi:hypothetical protein